MISMNRPNHLIDFIKCSVQKFKLLNGFGHLATHKSESFTSDLRNAFKTSEL